MKVQLVLLDRVLPYEKNPRKNQAAVPKVAASIQEFGFRNPILVDKDMVIIAGHTRLLAATYLGLEKVPVIVAADLSPEKVKALRIADNRTAEEAEWDDDLLKIELGELEGLGVALSVTGFDDDELRALFDGQGGIDIAAEDDEAGSGVEPDYLRFGKNKLPIGEDEIEALDKLLKSYVETNGLHHGFARWLCEGRDAA